MLNKNVINTFKKKWFLIFLIGIVIFFSSYIYTTMSYAIDSLRKPTFNFLESHRQEHFSFEMFNYLTEEETKYLTEQGYDVRNIFLLSDLKTVNNDLFYQIMELRKNKFEFNFNNYFIELREIKDISFVINDEEHKGRIIKDSNYINLTMVEEGRKPTELNEIAITKIYADQNNLGINDLLTINNINYKIVGFVLFPDYTFPLMGSNFIIDNARQSLMLLNDSAYEKIVGSELFYYAGLSKEEFNEVAFKKEVIDEYRNIDDLKFISSIITTKNQVRSGVIYDELNGGKAMSLVLSMIIASIAIIIVSILIHKIVKEQRGQIGVLKALGYTKKEIAIPYLIAIILIVSPFLLIGYLAGYYTAPFLRDIYLVIYLLPVINVEASLSIFIVSIFIPLIIFLILSYIVILKILSKLPLELLKPEEEKKGSKLSLLANKLLINKKAKTKFKYTFILRYMSKFYIFLWTIIFSSILILMAISMTNVMDKLIYDYYSRVDYVYQGYIDYHNIDKIILNDNKEKFLSFPDGIYKDDRVTLLGIRPNSKLHSLYDKKGNDITSYLEEGVVITEALNMKYKIKPGNYIDVEVRDVIYNLKVIGITEEYMEYKIYLDINLLSKIVTDSDDEMLFNGVFATEKLNEDNYRFIYNKKAMIDNAKTVTDFVNYMLYILTISAVSIALIVILVLTLLVVGDNYYSVSLLKVLGYNKKEINNMILNSYLIYSIVGYLLSIPLTIFIFKMTEDYLIHGYNMIFPLKIELWHLGIGFILMVVIFYSGVFLAKRNINKISLQEVLKTYRE